jgi:hypothetical protein
MAMQEGVLLLCDNYIAEDWNEINAHAFPSTTIYMPSVIMVKIKSNALDKHLADRVTSCIGLYWIFLFSYLFSSLL